MLFKTVTAERMLSIDMNLISATASRIFADADFPDNVCDIALFRGFFIMPRESG
jgi:hypothetical protein